MTRKHFIKTLVGLNHRVHAIVKNETSVRNINYDTLNRTTPPLSEVQRINPLIRDWSDFLQRLYDAIGITSMDDLK